MLSSEKLSDEIWIPNSPTAQKLRNTKDQENALKS